MITMKSIVRFILRSVLCILFLWQVRVSIQAYNLKHTVIVSSTEYRKNFTFPSFTFCPFDDKKSATNNLTADYEKNEDGSDPIYAIRQGFLKKPQFMSNSFISKITGPDLVHPFTRPYYATFAKLLRCVTYDPPDLSKSGRDDAALFIFNMTGLTRMLVVVHNHGMFIASSTNFHGLYQFQLVAPKSDNVGNDSFIPIIDYALESSFQEKLNYPIGPKCDNEYYARIKDNKSLTLESCYKEYVESKMECNLPWNSDAPWDTSCDKPADYENLKNVFDAIDSFTLPELQQNTLCSPPCGREEHKLVQYGKRNIKTDLSARKSKNLLGMTAHYKTSSYIKGKEVLRYDSKDIIADFGGYLGLLLGFSILNLFDLMLETVEKIKVASKMKLDSKVNGDF